MSKEQTSENVQKTILKFYDMRIETRTSSSGKIVDNEYSNYVIKIHTWIIFTPKEITEYTPKETNFYCYWRYGNFRGTGIYSYEDEVYIRKDEMPILPFIGGQYYLDEFCEEIGKDIAHNVIKKSKSEGKVYGKTISMGQKVRATASENDFLNKDSDLNESIRRALKGRL